MEDEKISQPSEPWHGTNGAYPRRFSDHLVFLSVAMQL